MSEPFSFFKSVYDRVNVNSVGVGMQGYYSVVRIEWSL